MTLPASSNALKTADTPSSEVELRPRKISYYQKTLRSLLQMLIPKGRRVLDIGCGTGVLLKLLEPYRGVGIDSDAGKIRVAREDHQGCEFIAADLYELQTNETFDYVLMSDLVGELDDLQKAFDKLHDVTDHASRVVITHYNYIWEPLIRLACLLGIKPHQPYQNWLSLEDISNLLYLSGYEVIRKGYNLLIPIPIPLISSFVNRYIAILPLVNKLCLQEYIIARRCPSRRTQSELSVSVIVPCRNERDNIDAAVARIPEMGCHTEIIFVDGASTDGTLEKIQAQIEMHRETKDIKLLHQVSGPAGAASSGHDSTPPNRMLSLGKGDAVRKGFDAASGDVLMILDSDLTVPPEELPKFYQAICEGKGEFINGTRLVYQLEKQAMRTLNIIGNKFFSLVFSWLLGQRIKDTLCGTKVLLKSDYEQIKAGRSYFGEFDPFGDFDLLFGACRSNLKITEIPIRYQARTYGDIKIERFKHGLILLRMSFFAAKKLKMTF